MGSIENSLPKALESTLVALVASKVLKKSSVSPKSKSNFLALSSVAPELFCWPPNAEAKESDYF